MELKLQNVVRLKEKVKAHGGRGCDSRHSHKEMLIS